MTHLRPQWPAANALGHGAVIEGAEGSAVCRSSSYSAQIVGVPTSQEKISVLRSELVEHSRKMLRMDGLLGLRPLSRQLDLELSSIEALNCRDRTVSRSSFGEGRSHLQQEPSILNILRECSTSLATKDAIFSCDWALDDLGRPAN